MSETTALNGADAAGRAEIAESAANTDSVDPTTTIVDDPAAIDTLRGQIDAIDTALLRLISERAQLSRRIQAARISAGGTRVQLGRERAIVDNYRAAVGAEGPALADAVLRVCRGAR